MAVTGQQRISAPSTFAMMLDGAEAGILRSVAGGEISAEVISESMGPSIVPRKRIGPPRYGDLEIQIGPGMEATLNKWIQSSCDDAVDTKNGSIVAYDVNLEARREIEFRQAFISEVTIPALDAGSKEPCYLTVKLTPELLRTHKVAGKLTSRPGTKQERWTASNFQLQIDGLDCSKVTSIDATSAKRKLIGSDGPSRSLHKQVNLELTNLVVTIAESGAATWYDWFESFVVNGKNGVQYEKTATLALLAPNVQTELARITFSNLGICRLALQDTAGDTPGRVTAELYYESLVLQLGQA